MSEYLGGDYIYNVLSNDATVTGYVGTSIYNARMVPDTDTSAETINFYMTGNFDAALEYGDFTWSIDCRSTEEAGALTIAIAVKDALNREHKSVSGYHYFGTVTILPVIPPVDNVDVYNMPVQLRVTRR